MRPQRAISLTRQATEEDSAGNLEAAYRLYDAGVDHFLAAIKCTAVLSRPCPAAHVWSVDEKNDKVKETIRKKVGEYLSRMETLKKALEERKNEPPPSKKQPAGVGGAKYPAAEGAACY